MTLNCHRGLRSHKSQSQNLSLQKVKPSSLFPANVGSKVLLQPRQPSIKGESRLTPLFLHWFLKAGKTWHMDISQSWHIDLQTSPNTSQPCAASCAPWMETLAEVKPFCTLAVLPSQNGSHWKATASLKQCYCSTQTRLGALLEITTEWK